MAASGCGGCNHCRSPHRQACTCRVFEDAGTPNRRTARSEDWDASAENPAPGIARSSSAVLSGRASGSATASSGGACFYGVCGCGVCARLSGVYACVCAQVAGCRGSLTTTAAAARNCPSQHRSRCVCVLLYAWVAALRLTPPPLPSRVDAPGPSKPAPGCWRSHSAGVREQAVHGCCLRPIVQTVSAGGARNAFARAPMLTLLDAHVAGCSRCRLCAGTG